MEGPQEPSQGQGHGEGSKVPPAEHILIKLLWFHLFSIPVIYLRFNLISSGLGSDTWGKNKQTNKFLAFLDLQKLTPRHHPSCNYNPCSWTFLFPSHWPNCCFWNSLLVYLTLCLSSVSQARADFFLPPFLLWHSLPPGDFTSLPCLEVIQKGRRGGGRGVGGRCHWHLVGKGCC